MTMPKHPCERENGKEWKKESKYERNEHEWSTRMEKNEERKENENMNKWRRPEGEHEWDKWRRRTHWRREKGKLEVIIVEANEVKHESWEEEN